MAVAEVAKSLIAGAAGAIALTVAHEAGRRTIKNAPRMDVLGRRALERWLPAIGIEPPDRRALQPAALAGDLVSNSLYYAMVGGRREGAWWRGTGLGLAAGLGAVTLPKPLGLGTAPHSSHASTNALTVAWYLIGGLTAAAVASALGSNG
jgi:hypothetical protein